MARCCSRCVTALDLNEAHTTAVLRGDRGLSAGFHGVPEWWLWRWVRRALGLLLASPARSWPLGGKDNLVADRAGRCRVPGCAGRGPGPRFACPAAGRDRRKLGYQGLVHRLAALQLSRGPGIWHPPLLGSDNAHPSGV